MKTVAFSGHRKVSTQKGCDFPALTVLSGLLRKTAYSVVELCWAALLNHRFYEDKIISLGLMTQAVALGNQILPQRFEVTLKNKLPISHFC